MITDVQRDAADRIAAEYDGPESVVMTPHCGPKSDRMVVAFPDGNMVVLDTNGNAVADSRRGDDVAPADIPARPWATVGYDPTVDALVIDGNHGDYTLVPPTRCALTPTPFLPSVGLDELLSTCRGWYRNVIGGELRVWRLRRGSTQLVVDP